MRELLAIVVCAVVLGGCASVRADRSVSYEWTTLAPGLRVDAARHAVEFDGQIAVDAHNADSPTVWLELMVTAPDTREHEALVVTRVKPSLIHAAMLAAGMTPGAPGRVRVTGVGEVERTLATGDGVRVEFVVGEGKREVVSDPARWVEHVETGAVLADELAWGGFVFSGSREVTRQGRVWYDADGTGVIVGLTTFGSEVVSPRMSLSPESGIDEPVWVAKGSALPSLGTSVRVRVMKREWQ